MKPQKKKRKNFFHSFKWAFCGIKECLKKEINFRFHIIMAFLVALFSFFFKVTTTEFIILMFCVALVLICEIINTVSEEICDFLTEEYNEKIKYIKDLSAGMVLISAVFSAITGLIIFIPHLLTFLERTF